MKTVILAEKPSVARDIAAVLGHFSNRKGYLENSQYIITWAIGHLAELAAPEDYHPDLKAWKKETLPIIPRQFMLKPAEKTKKHWKIVKSILKGKHKEIINACDAGREGELIFIYIYLLAKCKLPVRRLWLSETTPAAIEKAFKNLAEGSAYKNIGLAAMARAQADWLVGINGTRAYTLAHKTPGEKGAMSIGRVQTPTLALVVDREREIRNFVPETWWEVSADFESDTGIIYRGKWTDKHSHRITNEARAAEIVARVKNCPGKITEVKEHQELQSPPPLLSLGDLQKLANNRYGYSASETLELAQVLYERHRLITYPRTDSRYLTADIGNTLPVRLQALAGHAEYTSLVEKIINNPVPMSGVVNDAGVSDHHAIIPTEYVARIAKLQPDEYKIYDLVARTFIACFFPPAKISRKTITTLVADEKFITTGKSIDQLGWMQVFNSDIDNGSETELLPELRQGVNVTALDAASKQCRSQPPRRYTDATLISALENASRYVEDQDIKQALKQSKGVGTPATRAAIIERLISSGYVTRQGKYFMPTPKGERIIDLVPEELRSIELTGEWEQKLYAIEQGRGDPAIFMQSIHQLTEMVIAAAFNKGEGEVKQNGNVPSF